MSRFSTANPGADGNDAGEAVSALWNPHGSMSCRVYGVEVSLSSAITNGTVIRLSRISTRGTESGVYTPDLDNHHKRRAAPVTAAVITHGNFTVNPTEELPAMCGAVISQPVGSMVAWWFPEPIVVPFGTGLAVFLVAIGGGTSVGWMWEE